MNILGRFSVLKSWRICDMTEKLYYKDAYINEFCSNVLSCEKYGELYDVVLEKTAFFPEEGGQYSDKGFISGSRVIDVKEQNGIIHHYVNEPIPVDVEAECKIDFDERYEKMQCHSGEHILSGIIHSLYGLDNVGFHLGADDVTMDISAPLTKAELDKVEMLANEVIYKNVEIISYFPSADEASAIEYRSKSEIKENLRIVKIGEYDSCACCAPHVKFTGEIGIIKILDFAKLRGGIRIHITAGRRAMRLFREYYESALVISGMLSIPKPQISDGVKKLIEDIASVKKSYGDYRISNMKKEAGALEKITGNRVILFSDASVDELIAFSNEAQGKTEEVLVLLSGNDGNYKYVISSENIDLREKIKDINKNLLGRGGGKSNMVQGSFSCDYKSVVKYFNP